MEDGPRCHTTRSRRRHRRRSFVPWRHLAMLLSAPALLGRGRGAASAFVLQLQQQRPAAAAAATAALAGGPRVAVLGIKTTSSSNRRLYHQGRPPPSSRSTAAAGAAAAAGRAAAKPPSAPDDAAAAAAEEEEEEDLAAAAAAVPQATATMPTRVPNAIKPGTVYFVATPLGNLGDMTLRALDVLGGVDLIAAEDTRTTGLLLKALGLEKKPQVSHHQHNAAGRVPDLVRRARDERLSIAVVSDAGTPGVSDPGSELAAACWAAGVPLVPVPGACAAVAAVSVAGFPSTEFVFYGFLPSKAGKARRAKVAEVAAQEKPCVLYEAPHRVLKTLAELAAADEEEGQGDGEGGGREVVCARELTKLHEELFKGTLREAIAHFEARAPKGEFTLVVGPRKAGGPGAGASVEERMEAAKGLLRRMVGEEGLAVSEASKRVAKEVGLSKGEVYKLAMEIKEEEKGGEMTK